MEPTREVFWNIPREVHFILYGATILVLAIFFISVLQRMSIWLEGKDEGDDVLSGIGLLGALKLSLSTLFSTSCIAMINFFSRRVHGAKHAFLVWGITFKTRIFAKGMRGIMHIFIVWGFVILFLGTLITQLHYDFHLNFLRGNFYLIFSLLLDIGGLLLLLGASFLLLRRYRSRSERMITKREDLLALYLIVLIPLFGFMIEGLRLAVTKPQSMDWSPVGAFFAWLFEVIFGQREAFLKSLHQFAWVTHVSLVFFMILYIPYSKLFHMMAAQITLHESTRSKEEF